MDDKLIAVVEEEELRGYQKWGNVDTSPSMLLNAATEELGEVAHALNHSAPIPEVKQEIAEAIGVLSRLYDMVSI